MDRAKWTNSGGHLEDAGDGLRTQIENGNFYWSRHPCRWTNAVGTPINLPTQAMTAPRAVIAAATP
jgi:hypothetical protein